MGTKVLASIEVKSKPLNMYRAMLDTQYISQHILQ